MKSYRIVRLNQEYSTVTVLLNVDGKTLQQDVEVKDFDDADAIKQLVIPHLDKLEEDLKQNQPEQASGEVEALIDQEFVVEEQPKK